MKKLYPLIGLVATVIATPAFAHGNHVEEMTDSYFKEADTNNDGVITKDEAMAYAEKKFDRMDTNHDGQLTKEEVAAYKKTEMKNHPHKGSHSDKHKNVGMNDDQDRVSTSEDAKSNSKDGSNTGQ